MQYVSNTYFKLYIYKETDTNGAVGTTQIQVYMTMLVKENNVWVGQETQLGKATLKYFPGTNFIAIDTSTWSR